MHRLTFWLVVLVYLFASVQGCGFARDEGRFVNSTLKRWVDQLASGRGLCCSLADGVSVQVASASAICLLWGGKGT